MVKQTQGRKPQQTWGGPGAQPLIAIDGFGAGFNEGITEGTRGSISSARSSSRRSSSLARADPPAVPRAPLRADGTLPSSSGHPPRYAVDGICLCRYPPGVWDVEVTDQFEQWWDNLDIAQQQAIDAAVGLLEQRGPGLGRPLVDSIKGSRHANIRSSAQARSECCSRSTPNEPRSC